MKYWDGVVRLFVTAREREGSIVFSISLLRDRAQPLVDMISHEPLHLA